MRRKKRLKISKLSMNRVLRKNKWLAKFIPETRRMNRGVLEKMLRKYNMVYIKPCRGQQGNGVMRVEKMDRANTYRIRGGTLSNRYAGYGRAYRGIKKAVRRKPYLVQRGIRLLTHGGRAFDIRIMVQRNRKRRWIATGYVGRVAHPRKVVTNGSQGGTIYPVEVLLKGHMDRKKRIALIEKIKKISVESAKQYGAEYPGKEIGADIAIDRSHRLWILEINTIPDPCPFTKLNDRRMIRRIIRYGKAYGRRYRLKCTKSKKGL
jgi:glutathione synthase/RimK-type ligase-like ATP-grasp enzyme